ncbi:MAG: hypothetical protein KAY37_15545 [Phycisphaerae bacterium]|nr:hypothetical protein [Phycisphaerae bacterium]
MRTFTKRFPWAVGIGLPVIVIGALAISFGLLPRNAAADPPRLASVGQEAASLDISDIGRISVLNDGKVLAQWGDFLNPNAAEADEVVPYSTLGVETEEMDLVKAGSEWSLRRHDATLSRTAATSAVTLRIRLGQEPADADGCQRYAVFQMTGILTLQPATEGTGWLLSIEDLSGLERFSLKLEQKSPTAEPPSGRGGDTGEHHNYCSATCPGGPFHPGGSCEVDNCDGIAWCFCGLIGEPHCVCISRLFALPIKVTSAPSGYEAN